MTTCFGDAVAYRVYVYTRMLCPLQGGLSTDRPLFKGYNIRFSIKILDYYNITVHSLVCNTLKEKESIFLKLTDHIS